MKLMGYALAIIIFLFSLNWYSEWLGLWTYLAFVALGHGILTVGTITRSSFVGMTCLIAFWILMLYLWWIMVSMGGLGLAVIVLALNYLSQWLIHEGDL